MDDIKNDIGKRNISRREFRKAILPNIGDVINNGVVVYVHETAMWFSARGKATLGQVMEINDRLFKVSKINEIGDKWNANFIGFKNNPNIPNPPEEEVMLKKEKAIMKVLD